MKEPWRMTRQEFLSEVRNLYPNRLLSHPESYHRGLVYLAHSEGKLVPPEVLADYPDLAKAVKGEQAGMLGVPGKYFEQKRPWIPGQMGFESYAKYVEAMDKKCSLDELKTMCKERGLSTSGDKKTLARRLIEGR